MCNLYFIIFYLWYYWHTMLSFQAYHRMINICIYHAMVTTVIPVNIHRLTQLHILPLWLDLSRARSAALNWQCIPPAVVAMLSVPLLRLLYSKSDSLTFLLNMWWALCYGASSLTQMLDFIVIFKQRQKSNTIRNAHTYTEKNPSPQRVTCSL